MGHFSTLHHDNPAGTLQIPLSQDSPSEMQYIQMDITDESEVNDINDEVVFIIEIILRKIMIITASQLMRLIVGEIRIYLI